jgi:adenosine deaminase
VELHIHLEGTLEPELIFELAKRNSITLPHANLDELRDRYRFVDLQSFLDLYYANLDVVRTEDDFAALTRAYLARAHRGGVRHAELFFDPQAHTVRGIPLATCLDGIARGIRDSEAETGITATLIANFLRDRPVLEAFETLRALLRMRAESSWGELLIGVGLDSAEVGNPPGDFATVFELAHQSGLHLVAHAGEEGPPAYVWDALTILRVERVDHGVRSLEDPELVDYLVANAVPLTVCPFSNVRLRVVDTLADHPLPAMLAAGLLVSVNSDDPAYFGGYVDDNFRGLRDQLGWQDSELAQLAGNSIRSSFLPDERKAELFSAVDEWLRSSSIEHTR